MNSLQIKDKKNQLKIRCHEIIDSCKKEIREMTEEEKTEFEANKAEIVALNEQLNALQEKLAMYEKELPDDEEEEVEEKALEDEDEDVLPNDEEEDEENKEEIKRSINTMKKEFRLLNAIRNIANNRGLDNVAESVNNAGKKEMRKAGMSFGGQIQIPTQELRDITVANEGEDVVKVDMMDILEPLRAKNVLAAAGARFLTGLVGDVQIPSMNASNVSWEGETVAAKDGAATFDSIKLQPKRLTAYIDLSKQFLAQDSLSAEALIRQDLVNAINSKLESTVLGAESGTTTMPEGLFYNTGTTATISDFKGICEAEAEVEDANVMGECKYIMSNKAKAVFRNMAKSAKSTELVMEHDEIDGTPVLNSSNVNGKHVAYGDFSNLFIGQWGAIDLTVDPYTLAKDGKVRLVVNAYFDAKVARPNAIAKRKVA